MKRARLAAYMSIVLLGFATSVGAVIGGSWVTQGGGFAFSGTGAVKTLAPHPSNADILYAGAVNGGVWMTTNATAASPHWTPLTDTHPSPSIGALEFDPTDATNQTLVAGIGSYSAFNREGGRRNGLLRTTDGGASWADLTALAGFRISGVAGRGSTIVASAEAGIAGCPDVGVYRSTDTGATFAQVLSGFAFDLASDPNNDATLYTGVPDATDQCGSGLARGIYESTDTGATWMKISNAALDTFITGSTCNIKIAARGGTVYVGVVNAGVVVSSGFCHLAAVFRSGDAGATWTQMDLPGGSDGINPGGQGQIHFSIAADPTNTNIVYVGGDEPGVFRGDASQPSGSQWASIEGANTFSGTFSHPDSRRLVFDANGDLLESDDGGPFRRTSPRTSSGDWFSLCSDLYATELHDVAYDTVSHVTFGGAQDNGTGVQISPSSTAWEFLAGGDGGDVAVDVASMPGESIRYFSSQFLFNFTRAVYDSANVLQSTAFPALTVLGGGAPLAPQFKTPVKLNRIDPSRMVIVGSNSIYESLDEGDTITEIGPGQGNPAGLQDAIAYGGRRLGVDNVDALYVGNGNQVLVRTMAGGALTASATYSGPFDIVGIAMDPNDWMHAVVADAGNVFETTDAGGSWTNVTGNLGTFEATRVLSVTYVAAVPNDLLMVGTDAQVFVSFRNDFTVWDQMGTGLPNALVWDLAYDPYDDVLVAGTLGRGAWKLGSIGGTPPPTTTTTTTTTTSTTTTTTLPSCPPSPPACQPALSQGAQLKLKDPSPDKAQVGWKWKSSLAVAKSDFGDPTTTHYLVCIYDAGGLKLEAVAPAGRFCGTKPCWSESAKGFKYGDKSGTPDGVTKLGLAAADVPGKAKITLKAKGPNLSMPTLPLTVPVKVQLSQTASTTCWEATYSAAVRNDGQQFIGKSD